MSERQRDYRKRHRLSTIRTLTPARASALPHMTPAGPAPKTRTSTQDSFKDTIELVNNGRQKRKRGEVIGGVDRRSRALRREQADFKK